MNLKDAVTDLCPAPPPCFLNYTSWREYLQSAAGAQNQRSEPKIIIVIKGEPTINTEFDYCIDCTTGTRQKMVKADKCKPDWMRT